jgi:hypothetical protein
VTVFSILNALVADTTSNSAPARRMGVPPLGPSATLSLSETSTPSDAAPATGNPATQPRGGRGVPALTFIPAITRIAIVCSLSMHATLNRQPHPIPMFKA